MNKHIGVIQSIVQCIVATLLIVFVLLQPVFAQNSANDCAAQIQQISTAKDSRNIPNDQPNKNLDWQKIDYLPDYWDQRWPDYVGTAWYKIEFNYQCPHPQEPLLLVISNITMAGEIFINDDILWKDRSLTEPLSRSWNAPRQWSLPQSSLKQGQNIVWVKVVGVAIQPSGLGDVKIASQYIAQPIYEQYKFELNTLHIFSFLFSVILGFIGLIIWLFHRKDRSFAWYAINSFLWAMYLVHVLIREPIFGLSTFEYHKINNILFGFYALASVMYGFSFANLRFKKIEWFLWAAVGISTLLILCLPEAQALQFIPLSFAFWVLVFLLNGCLYPIVAYKSKRKDTYFLAALGLVFVPIAIHDAMYMLSLDGGVAWSAYAQPVVAIAFAMILALRFSNNMKQIERFNDTLTTTIEQVKTDLSESLNKSHQLELQNTKLQERMSISHDLHDGLGSSLMRSMAIVQQSSKDLSNPQFLSMLKVLRDDLRQIIDQGSSLGAKIPDTPQQWIAPMRHRFNSLFDELDVRATWQIAAEWHVPISSIECLTLQRIIEEALTNVIKHSGADQIQIELLTKTDYLKLSIEDNGKGFDIDAVQQANMSVGMKSLNERAARIGAEIKLNSSAHGTRLEIIKHYQRDGLS